MNSISLPVGSIGIQPRARRGDFWRRLVREPLTHFALIGVAIFAFAHAVASWKQESQASIGIDAALSERLANLYRSQFGAPASAVQLRAIVEDYIDDEVLYREALRLGLDQDDEIIRRRLIQKLEFLQRDAIESANPAPAQLRAYYDAHPQSFSASPHVSFVQVYFNPDKGGEQQAQSRARDTRVQLLAGEAQQAGDEYPLDHEYEAVTRDDAIRIFGASAFVDALFGATPGEWSEPVRSGLGWHLLKVTAAEPARLLPFEEVQPDVRAAYLHEATARARRAQLDRLRTHYHVVSRGAP